MTEKDVWERLARIEERLEAILENQQIFKAISDRVTIIETRYKSVVGFFAFVGAVVIAIAGAVAAHINLGFGSTH